MIVVCDVEPAHRRLDDYIYRSADSRLYVQIHQATSRCTHSRRCNARRVMHGWLGIEADLRLQPLIRLSFLTLEPVDGPSDEYGYDAGV